MVENREAPWLAPRHTASVGQDSCLGKLGRGRLRMDFPQKEGPGRR